MSIAWQQWVPTACELISCPMCPDSVRDHVTVEWFQRLCHISGVQWRCPRRFRFRGLHSLSVLMKCRMTRVCRFLVVNNICTSVVSFVLSILVVSIAHSATRVSVMPRDLFRSRPSILHGTHNPPRHANLMVVPTRFPAPPASLVFLCCPHLDPNPSFEQQDRRWSVGSSALGSSPTFHQEMLEFGVPVASVVPSVKIPNLVLLFKNGWNRFGSPTGLFPRLAICMVGEQFQYLPSRFPLISLGLLDAELARVVPAYSASSSSRQAANMLDVPRFGHHPCSQPALPVPESFVCRRPRFAVFVGSRRSQSDLFRMPDLRASPEGARVTAPNPLSRRCRFSLVVMLHVQVQRTFPLLHLLIVFQQFQERKSHEVDRNPPQQQARL